MASVGLETDDEQEELENVQKILQLLLSSCNQLPESSEEFIEGRRLSEWLDMASAEIMKSDLGELGFNSDVSSREMDNLLSVMRECFLTHRWSAALRILTSFVNHAPLYYGATVLHGVLELCTQLDVVPPASLMLLLKQYSKLTEQRVAVEHLMFCASSGAAPSACRSTLAPLQRKRTVHPAIDLCDVEREKHEYLLLRAYDGLMSYAEFTSAQRFLNSSSAEKDLLDNAAVKMAPCARSALDKWEGIAGSSGVWDVFISKQVELLEFVDKTDVAENVLLSYAQKNTNLPAESGGKAGTQNVWPNALRMLYHFYVRHPLPNDDQKKISILQDLCAAVPSDELALDLYRLSLDGQVSTGLGSDRVALLFELLDYAAWKDSLQLWKYLASELQLCASPTDSDIDLPSTVCQIYSIAVCWKSRADWWPPFHFHKLSIPCTLLPDDVTDLVGVKAAVAYFLMGSRNDYTQTLLACAEDCGVKIKSISRLKKLIRKFNSLELLLSTD